MAWYGPANKTAVGNSGGTYTGGPAKGLLHTTEGSSAGGAISAYRANNSWPHFTVDNAGVVWQHVDTALSARALQNLSGGVQTNRDHVIQIEVTGFAAKPNEHSHAQMNALRTLMRWIELVEGVQPKGPGRPFATAYGQAHLRFSNTEWENFNGWCGHCHAPENLHWDPGAIDLASLLPGVPAPEPPPPPTFVTPQYSPALVILGGIAAHLKAPAGGVWILGSQGHIYAFDCPHFGQPAGQPYFNQHKAALLESVGEGYMVIAKDNTRFVYAPGFGTPPDELLAMYEPPLVINGGIAAHLKSPDGGIWLLSPEGAIFAFNAPYYGAANGQAYFVGRTAARLEPNGLGYRIIATSGEEYNYA